MTFDELYRAILEVMPAAQLGEDQDGQLIVYTDLMIDEGTHSSRSDGELVPYEMNDEEIVSD